MLSRSEFIGKYGIYLALLPLGVIVALLTEWLGSVGGAAVFVAFMAAMIYWDDWRTEKAAKAAKEKNDAL